VWAAGRDLNALQLLPAKAAFSGFRAVSAALFPANREDLLMHCADANWGLKTGAPNGELAPDATTWLRIMKSVIEKRI